MIKYAIVIKRPYFAVLERESDIESPTKTQLIEMLNRPDLSLTEDDVTLFMSISPLRE